MVEALLQVRDSQQLASQTAAAAQASPAELEPEPEPELEPEPEPEPEPEQQRVDPEPEPEPTPEVFTRMARELLPAAALEQPESELKAEPQPAEDFLGPEPTCTPEFPFDVTFSEPGQLGLSLVRAATGRTIVSRAIPGTQAAR
jgi:hypothetical protein